MNIRTLYRNGYYRIPLTFKLVAISIVTGIALWIILDYIQSRRIKDIFLAQLTERLGQQAMEDRLRFDRYIKVYQHLARLFIIQKNFSDYVESRKWREGNTAEATYYEHPPPWFPGRSMLYTLASPRYALLIDSRGNVREVYQGWKEPLPRALLYPAGLLIEKSREQSYLITFDSVPYLITSAPYMNPRMEILTTLMLATPIDEKFLNASMGGSTERGVVALLTPGENPRVLTSSNLLEIPAGTPLDVLQGKYLITGKEFFDYGSSELVVRFASFISMTKVNSLTRTLIMKERRERAISAFVFIIAFAVVTFWIMQRIQRLTRRVADFSQHTLGVQQQEIHKGDQPHILEERFQHLTEEVVKSREIIKRQAEEQTRLIVKNALEKEASIIQAKLIHANKMTSLGTLVSGVAHEINNPNSFIMSNAQLFNEIWKDIFHVLEEHYQKKGDFAIGDMSFSELQNHVPRLLNSINKGTERIKNIVDSLKSFARTDGGGMEGEVNVNRVVENAIFFLNAEIKKYTNKFHVICEDNIPCVKGSGQQLEQVVINLLMNSLQALNSRDKGVWITTSHDEKENVVVIKVKDEGCGIPEDILDRITEPFFTTKLDQGGTGLGLSISYAIVKEHKGIMEFTSEPDRGITACVKLPVYNKISG